MRVFPDITSDTFRRKLSFDSYIDDVINVSAGDARREAASAFGIGDINYGYTSIEIAIALERTTQRTEDNSK